MWKKTAQRRTAGCYFLILFAMFLSILRIIAVALYPEYAAAAQSESGKSITVGYKRGTIFDCNLNRLTNAEEKIACVITDTPAAVLAASEYFQGEELDGLLNELKQNGIAVRFPDREITAEGIFSVRISEHIGSDTPALHIIGYTDAENHGVCGLEAAFDRLLYSEEKTEISFTVDGHGNILYGAGTQVNNSFSAENSGLVTTLDLAIQKAAEQAAEELVCGAVVVTEVKSGKIRALVSKPAYDPENLAAALTDENSPLLNRALCTYNVGSVFKPCVAAAALDRGKQDFQYTCIGYADIDGLIFRCHKASGHGEVDLAAAIKFSCNTFFYNFALSVGADAVYETARKAGFADSVVLADGIAAEAGSIGSLDMLRQSQRALANLAIGQGDLMLSPVGITTLYTAIASDGTYRAPSLIEGKVKNGEIYEREPETAPVRLMKEETARTLRSYLAGVLEEDGTGAAAKPQTVTAAGKTATAQTGIVRDGKSVINSWFCGFFPLEEPEYVITVLAENASGGCASVFAETADLIMAAKSAEVN